MDYPTATMSLRARAAEALADKQRREAAERREALLVAEESASVLFCRGMERLFGVKLSVVDVDNEWPKHDVVSAFTMVEGILFQSRFQTDNLRALASDRDQYSRAFNVTMCLPCGCCSSTSVTNLAALGKFLAQVDEACSCGTQVTP